MSEQYKQIKQISRVRGSGSRSRYRGGQRLRTQQLRRKRRDRVGRVNEKRPILGGSGSDDAVFDLRCACAAVEGAIGREPRVLLSIYRGIPTRLEDPPDGGTGGGGRDRGGAGGGGGSRR